MSFEHGPVSCSLLAVVALALLTSVSAKAQPTIQPGNGVRVELSPPVGLSFYRGQTRKGALLSSGREWIKLCDHECTVSLAPGTYHLAAGKSPESLLFHRGALTIDRDVRIEGDVESRSGKRLFGGVLFGVSSVGGGLALGFGLAGYIGGRDCEEDCALGNVISLALIAGGALVLGAVAVPSALMFSRKDEIVLKKREPGDLSRRKSRFELAARGLGLHAQW